MYRLAWPPSRALALALALSASEFLAAAPALATSDLARFAPPGRIVLVEGRQVHIHCAGAGAPTVLLEEGRGGASLNWAWIQRDVTTVSRVRSYDRPGTVGAIPDAAIDATLTSQQPYALLEAATKEQGPYILVGHSIGGAYLRMFAAQHREEVAGLVLVDATPPPIRRDMSRSACHRSMIKK